MPNLKAHVLDLGAETKFLSLQVGMDPNKAYRYVWKDNVPQAAQTMRNGQLTVSLNPKGMTALAIEDVKATPYFQHRIGKGKPVPGKSYHRDTENGFHRVLLNPGEGLTTAYLYLDSQGKQQPEIESAQLHYRTDNEWKTVTDDSYPFELTIPPADDVSDFEFYIEKINFDGSIIKSEHIKLADKK